MKAREMYCLEQVFYLKLIGAFLTLFILAIAVNFTSNDKYTNILIFIVASATIFQSFNVIDFYFQSKVLSKYVVYTNIISLFYFIYCKNCTYFKRSFFDSFCLDGFV